MNRAMYLISGSVFLGFMATAVIAGQPTSSLTPPPGQAGKARVLEVNEANARFNLDAGYALIDVNDRFLIKTSDDGLQTTASFGILEGTRAKYGTCGSGLNPEKGERGTSWVHVSYTPTDVLGEQEITVRRTADFFGHERIYRFKTNGSAQVAQLDQGVSVEIDKNILTYVQHGGPIGTSGKVSNLRLNYQLSDSVSTVNAIVEMDSNMWTISTDNRDSTSPIYSVNSKPIAGTSLVLATPVEGPGITEDYVVKASANKTNIDEIETREEEVDQNLCYQGKQCFTEIDCMLDPTSSCLCHDSDGPGGMLGICLL